MLRLMSGNCRNLITQQDAQGIPVDDIEKVVNDTLRFSDAIFR